MFLTSITQHSLVELFLDTQIRENTLLLSLQKYGFIIESCSHPEATESMGVNSEYSVSLCMTPYDSVALCSKWTSIMDSKNLHQSSPPKDGRRDGFATISEAALFLGMSKGYIRKLIANEQIPYVRLGRSVRIPWRHLQKVEECATRVVA